MENNDKFLSQELLESYAIRLLSGPLNGCEYEILNGRLLVIIGNDVSLGRSDAFSELPENTIVVPYGELTGSFEIIITTDHDLVVTFRELTAQEPEDRTLTLNQQIEVLGLKFAVKEKMKFGSIHCQALLKITLFLQNNISLAVSCLSM
ncbi:type III secretion protein [Shigella sonnei]|nr:type III secretion protein [Escherichia coli]OYG60371.1 type III secretion protein [Shigella sonnei]OYK22412.1 type III secretion protein [Shigella sonnei]BDY65604.1 hypothetical protein MUTS7_38450 [Escherichia coli]